MRHDGLVVITIDALWPNVKSEAREMIVVSRQFTVNSDLEPTILVAEFASQVEAHERHESQEWLKINGVCHRDPH